MKKRKILLVDDHPVVREGFARLLGESALNEVVGQVDSGEAAICFAKEHEFDVAIVDINMENMDGLRATEKLKSIRSEMKVVILSVNEVEPFISRSFDVGADAFLSKRCAPEELIKAIDMVCHGEQYLSEHVYRQIALDKLNKKENLLKTLTNREFEVFQHLVRGDSMSDIAGILHISPKTGYVFRGNILKKLKLTSLAELIQLAHRHDIV